MALHMDPEILAVLGPIGQGPPVGDDVGVLDILRDENIDFARRLMAAGVSTELHVLPGLPTASKWSPQMPKRHSESWQTDCVD
jgi:acetyl esterase/lipase